MCDNDGDVIGRRWAQGLSENNGGVGGHQGIDNSSRGSETTTEAAAVRLRYQGIYNYDGGVGGGREQLRRGCLWRLRIRRRFIGIGDNNGGGSG